MRNTIVYLFILGSLFSNAQNREWTLKYENNVNKIRLDNINSSYDTRGYQNLPQYFDNFDASISSRFRSYSDDTIGYETARSSYKTSHNVYFRNTYIGIGTNIYTSKFIDITHSAGLNLSLADFRLGNVRSYIDAKFLLYDSAEMTQQEYRKNKSITAYKKVRRIALNYENALRLKPIKWLNISLGARHQLHFKFTDHLLTGYSDYSDTITLYQDYLFGVDEGVKYFGIGNINLYDRQYPSSLADKSVRDLSLQYDLTLFLRPEFVLGKAKRTSLYLNIGYTPIHFYGKDFIPKENPLWYGLGLSRRL